MVNRKLRVWSASVLLLIASAMLVTVIYRWITARDVKELLDEFGADNIIVARSAEVRANEPPAPGHVRGNSSLLVVGPVQTASTVDVRRGDVLVVSKQPGVVGHILLAGLDDGVHLGFPQAMLPAEVIIYRVGEQEQLIRLKRARINYIMVLPAADNSR